jgi:hypothetical protein
VRLIDQAEEAPKKRQRSAGLIRNGRNDCLVLLQLTWECGKVSRAFGEVEMTTSEQKVLWRGVAAGTIMGLALGLMIALFIAIRARTVLGL